MLLFLLHWTCSLARRSTYFLPLDTEASEKCKQHATPSPWCLQYNALPADEAPRAPRAPRAPQTGMLILSCGLPLSFRSFPCPALSCPVLSQILELPGQKWRMPGVPNSCASALLNCTPPRSCSKDDVGVKGPSCMKSIKSSFTVQCPLSSKTAVLQTLQKKIKNPKNKY